MRSQVTHGEIYLQTPNSLHLLLLVHPVKPRVALQGGTAACTYPTVSGQCRATRAGSPTDPSQGLPTSTADSRSHPTVSGSATVWLKSLLLLLLSQLPTRLVVKNHFQPLSQIIIAVDPGPGSFASRLSLCALHILNLPRMNISRSHARVSPLLLL